MKIIRSFQNDLKFLFNYLSIIIFNIIDCLTLKFIRGDN